MVHKPTASRNVFTVANHCFLLLLAFLCLFPLIHVLALSFSSSGAATAGFVKLWPVQFTLSSYEYVLRKPQFFQSIGVSVQRVLLGTTIMMLMSVHIGYALSKEVKAFRWRTAYAWFFVFTILFHGGLIPWYMTIKQLGILDTIWALVLPSAVAVFNTILLLNFFRMLPKELEEAAFMDGAGHWTTLWKIFIPVSVPALATITLFAMVWHWNSWFDGLILMNSPEHYPMQSYLRTVVIQKDVELFHTDDLKLLAEVSDRTFKAAQIFLGALPILLVYPFLQKFFVKGIVMGSVKE